jgi:hypothetical protein
LLAPGRAIAAKVDYLEARSVERFIAHVAEKAPYAILKCSIVWLLFLYARSSFAASLKLPTVSDFRFNVGVVDTPYKIAVLPEASSRLACLWIDDKWRKKCGLIAVDLKRFDLDVRWRAHTK